MISCKDVSTLLMSDQLQAQPWTKRAQVRFHLAMCRLCSRLARQISQMRASARQIVTPESADPGLEERLIRRLSDK